MKMPNVLNKVMNSNSRAALLVKKNSPELLMGAGVVSVIGSTVLACKATLKLDAIVDEAKETMQKVDDILEDKDGIYADADYSVKDGQKDKYICTVQTAVKIGKLYAPAVALGVLGITCFLGAHNIMNKRNVAVVAAYTAAEKSFADYRKRVVEKFGADEDREMKMGIVKEKLEEVILDKDGKEKKVKTEVEVPDPNHYSQYARFFDESSRNWSKNAEHNLFFLKAQQNYANDLLKAKGHVFLNEVYDMLDIPRTKAGAVTGWVKGKSDFVDFGMYDSAHGKARDFVNGYEAAIFLDFNVAGVIYNLI